MSKRPTQREINRSALMNAAALIDAEDFTNLYGEEFDAWGDDEVVDEMLAKGHQYAVDRIRSLVKS